jgi:RNA recognition motif-containing protein
VEFKDPLRDVFVVGLDVDQELFLLAAKHGVVLDAKIVRDHKGQSRGFGFVRYATPEDARKGIAALDGLALAGRGGSQWRRVLHASPLRPPANPSRAKEKSQ